jgi:hypothetical protein
MIPAIKLVFFLFLPGLVSGIEFYSNVMDQGENRWYGSVFSDSLPVFRASILAFRGYPGTDINEGGVIFVRGKGTQAMGLDCRFQFHELLSSQAFSVIYYCHISELLMGALSGTWNRSGPKTSPSYHELSLSWCLIFKPVPWLDTSVSYKGKPSYTFPEKKVNLTSPGWSGHVRFIVPGEAYISTGVLCYDGFYPEWTTELGFNGGAYTTWSLSWFSLSRSVNGSFKIIQHPWTLTWICRWHPLLGLSGGSVLSRSF